MATSDSGFSFADLDALGIDYRRETLFPKPVMPVESSAWLTETLAMNHEYRSVSTPGIA